MNEGARTLFLRVTGTVQGVGYRAFACEMARHLGVSGWVVNRDDGSVEAVAHGSGGALAELVGALRKGPPGAQVEGLDLRSADPRTAEEAPEQAYSFEPGATT